MSYALIFKGHDFEYEIQAVAKIFIPNVRFELCREQQIPVSDNRILTEFDRNQNLLKTEIFLNGKFYSDSAPAPAETSEQEFRLCKMLYTGLQTLTGYQPPWGMLTGIRPVRKVLDALEQGLTPEQACSELKQKYLISNEKLQLALQTALIQKKILPHSLKEIGLYISIPFCPTRCSYCSFVSHSIESAKNLIPDYVGKLCQEIQILGELIQKYDLSVQSVYIGGGTPTSVSAEQLRKIMQAIRNHVDMSHTREYTVEAGRPDTITEEKLQVIREMNADRISVNPQTLQDSVLQKIGRCHTAQQAVEAFQLARKLGFDNINMDLIAGLPSDTYEGFSDTLRKVIALHPDSITVHTLTVKRAGNLYHDEQHQNTEIPIVEKMAGLSAELLPENGYQPYYLYRQKNTLGNLENVGYSRTGKENLYNILIMDDRQTILGAGCGASSKIITSGGNLTRVMNYKFPYEYINRFGELMTKKQQIAIELEELT
ncbi:MAG: coproporphyrinogen dehydrogenase HemZ [Oscillospiraceae bacterium]|nr:coproporphyrinogen dehydrogenase HemZ [Oscillospiraceae bacterium]